MTACVDTGSHTCAMEGTCRVQPHWAVVNNAVRGALADINLMSVLR
jgi:DNA-binding IscR family transcriptional regulator